MSESSYVRTYARLPGSSPGVRGMLRHGALSAFALATRVAGLQRRCMEQPRVQFLYLHYVFEDQEEAFRRLLDVLARQHRFISYSEAVRRIHEGAIDAPYVTFSFDDGLKNNLKAARILEAYGAPACFFVCPAVVDRAGEFEASRRFAEELLHLPPVEFMTWADLEVLQHCGHEIGAHTMTHPNLAALDASALRAEVEQSQHVLESRLGSAAHFAWPYGRFAHFSALAMRTVFEAGFASCASAERGCHTEPAPEPRALCIRRDHVVPSWPVGHTLAFMGINMLRADRQRNAWPDAWTT